MNLKSQGQPSDSLSQHYRVLGIPASAAPSDVALACYVRRVETKADPFERARVDRAFREIKHHLRSQARAAALPQTSPALAMNMTHAWALVALVAAAAMVLAG